MTRTIKNPRWNNQRKTQVVCEFHYDDGRVLKAYVSDTDEGNPDWKEIMEIFGSEQLDKNTDDHNTRAKQHHELRRQQQKERVETVKNEELFNMKLEMFSIQEIKESKNSALKSKIRRAKNPTELMAYSSLLLTTEYLKTELGNDTIPKVEKSEPIQVQVLELAPVQVNDAPSEKPKRGRKKTK